MSRAKITHENEEHVCPRFHRALELVRKRWNGAVIRALMDRPRGFGEILEAVPDLHDRRLYARLKELEAQEIVQRRVYPETPGRIEYALTERGRDPQRLLGGVEP